MEQKHVQNLVGPVVRRLRMDSGLSQEAMAAKLQVAGWDLSRAGLSKIEARLRRVNDAELIVLAKVLKCGVAELFPKRPRNLGYQGAPRDKSLSSPLLRGAGFAAPPLGTPATVGDVTPTKNIERGDVRAGLASRFG